MNTDIQLQIDEAANGTLMVMLTVVAIYFASYLRASWRNAGSSWRLFNTYENKTALALFTILSCAAAKTAATWWAIHVHRHGGHYGSFVSGTFVVGTLGILWGTVCLLRAVARYDWPRHRWMMMIAWSVAFGAVTLLF